MTETFPFKKHGLWNTKEYRAWDHMIRRCYEPHNNRYKNYGARGIIVCERWRHSVESFVADMGKCPPGRTLDRIDNNGNYEPSNCRWANAEEQQNNRTASHLITHEGKTKTITQWSRDIGLCRVTILKRLQRGLTVPEALNPTKIKPPGRRARI